MRDEAAQPKTARSTAIAKLDATDNRSSHSSRIRLSHTFYYSLRRGLLRFMGWGLAWYTVVVLLMTQHEDPQASMGPLVQCGGCQRLYYFSNGHPPNLPCPSLRTTDPMEDEKAISILPFPFSKPLSQITPYLVDKSGVLI